MTTTTRRFYLACTECEWSGNRRVENDAPCPWCGAEVRAVERRTQVMRTIDDLHLVRPSVARAPFGIPTSARMRPWHDGTRILPNGLRAKVVRIPSLADAFDDANLQRSESVAEISEYGGWNKVPV